MTLCLSPMEVEPFIKVTFTRAGNNVRMLVQTTGSEDEVRATVIGDRDLASVRAERDLVNNSAHKDKIYEIPTIIVALGLLDKEAPEDNPATIIIQYP